MWSPSCLRTLLFNTHDFADNPTTFKPNISGLSIKLWLGHGVQLVFTLKHLISDPVKMLIRCEHQHGLACSVAFGSIPWTKRKVWTIAVTMPSFLQNTATYIKALFMPSTTPEGAVAVDIFSNTLSWERRRMRCTVGDCLRELGLGIVMLMKWWFEAEFLQGLS